MNNTRLKIQNPFQQIYESPKCKRPYTFPLPEFPLLLDIEATNACNIDCLMCPRQRMVRKIGFMEMKTFKKILEEVLIYKPGIRFIRCGEPLLHSDIFNFVSLVKKHGLICHITTNGLLMNEEIIERIIASGLDSIIFSFQGSNKEEYERMRNNKSYDLLKSNIHNLRIRRDRARLDRPFIQINTTFLDETEQQKQNYFNEWKEVSDKVDYWYTTLFNLSEIERVKPLLKRQKVKEITGAGKCTEIMTKLSINWNGDVTACCADYNGEMIIGNVENNRLRDIWHSEELNRIREILSRGRHKDFSLCSSCTTKFIEQ